MGRVSRHSGKLSFSALALAIAAIPLAGAWAAAENADAPLTEEQMAKGRQLFTDNSCTQCHALADADAQGSIGPPLDGDANLTHDFVVDRITNGSGPMPSFGWLAPEDIDLLARYIVQAKK
ncbi:MAG: cytochrome c [Altererythrobacter sp.]|nr:cytochrome c [Altererythrobacter sp.]